MVVAVIADSRRVLDVRRWIAVEEHVVCVM